MRELIKHGILYDRRQVAGARPVGPNGDLQSKAIARSVNSTIQRLMTPNSCLVPVPPVFAAGGFESIGLVIDFDPWKYVCSRSAT